MRRFSCEYTGHAEVRSWWWVQVDSHDLLVRSHWSGCCFLFKFMEQLDGCADLFSIDVSENELMSVFWLESGNGKRFKCRLNLVRSAYFCVMG